MKLSIRILVLIPECNNIYKKDNYRCSCFYIYNYLLYKYSNNN